MSECPSVEDSVLIAEARKADIPQAEFVARYMGFTLDEVLAISKIAKRSKENEIAKKRIREWEASGKRILTEGCIPEQSRMDPAVLGSLNKLSGKNGSRNFVRYCGETYFCGCGLFELIEDLTRKGYMTNRTAYEWKCSAGVL